MKGFDFYGSALLGIAIRILFPKATYLGSAVHPRGFSATFSDDIPFQEGYLSMLEEEIRNLSSKPIQIMEMLGSNAMEMLAHHEQPSLHKLSGIVFALKLDSFFEVCEGKPEVAGDLTLTRFSQEGKRITVEGKAFKNKQQRQQFEKRYRKWIAHDELAKKLELYEGKTFHPRGMLLRRFLEEYRRKFFQSLGFLEIETPDPASYAKEHDMERLICGNYFYQFGSNALISSLQIIQKWIKIFGFEWHFVFGAKKLKKDIQNTLERAGISLEADPYSFHSFLELQVVDYLGCSQRGALLEPVDQGYCFSFADLHQWIALLLEKDRGKLPDWLAPEQVRLLTEKGVEISQVTKIFRIANIRYTMDRGDEPLKEKMYRALRVNVPYVMVFGNHEEKTNQMMIRASSSKQCETIPLTQLHQFFSELQIESE